MKKVARKKMRIKFNRKKKVKGGWNCKKKINFRNHLKNNNQKNKDQI